MQCGTASGYFVPAYSPNSAFVAVNPTPNVQQIAQACKIQQVSC